ncbi:hypothetical protein LCGC14_2080800 [marine sediment metagenome]|uniref:DUF4296 domain-containing protein n=1 Tax=marine sediment metagenome TaxID=412755 RepID=A0A0F9HCM6_9ZZZZ
MKKLFIIIGLIVLFFGCDSLVVDVTNVNEADSTAIITIYREANEAGLPYFVDDLTYAKRVYTNVHLSDMDSIISVYKAEIRAERNQYKKDKELENQFER